MSGTKNQVLPGQRLLIGLVLKSCCYEPHIQPRKEEFDASKNQDFKVHRYRWVVEIIRSWINHFIRVLTRWERKTENYEANFPGVLSSGIKSLFK